MAASRKKGNFGTDMQVHTGLLLAVRERVNSGPHLQTVEFRFLPPVSKAEWMKMDMDANLDQWNSQNRGMDTMQFDDRYVMNSNPEGTANKTYEFGGLGEVEYSHKIEKGNEKTWGATIDFKNVLSWKWPLVNQNKTLTSLDVGGQFLYVTKEINSLGKRYATKVPWKEAGSLAPGKSVHCNAQSLSGHFTSGFTSTIQVTLESGSKFTYQQPGSYDHTGYTEGWSDCRLMETKDVKVLLQHKPGFHAVEAGS